MTKHINQSLQIKLVRRIKEVGDYTGIDISYHGKSVCVKVELLQNKVLYSILSIDAELTQEQATILQTKKGTKSTSSWDLMIKAAHSYCLLHFSYYSVIILQCVIG